MNSNQIQLKEIETIKLKDALMTTEKLNPNDSDSSSCNDIVEKVTEELKRLITDDLDENISELDKIENIETPNLESKIKGKAEAETEEVEVEVDVFVDASTVLLDSKHEGNAESKNEHEKASVEKDEPKEKSTIKVSDKKKAKNFKKKGSFKKKKNTSNKKPKKEKEIEGACNENNSPEPKEQSEDTEGELNIGKIRNNSDSKPYHNSKQNVYRNYHPLNVKSRKTSYGVYFDDSPPLMVRDFSDGFASRPRYNNFKQVHYNGYRPNYQHNNVANHGAPMHIHPNRIHSNPSPPFRPIRRRNASQYNQWTYYTPLDNRDQFYGHNPFQKNNKSKAKDSKSQDDKENFESFNKKGNIPKRHRKRSFNQEASSKNVTETPATEESDLKNELIVTSQQEQKLENKEPQSKDDPATVSNQVFETIC